ncbi:MAG TPA: hypothetical protein VF591_11900 [Pyrinomonadaceae bacterium]|jgi:hypothetical protein
MSDYLWDKKGEPDAEVARLEALLGAFAHEPRRLELPAGAAAPAPPPARLLPFASRPRASRLFAPAALAAAAALVVASVLVASVFLRARVAPEREQAMIEPPPPAVKVNDKTPAAGVRAQDEKVKVEKAAVESLPRVAHRRKDAQVFAASGRRQKVLAAEPAARGAGGGLTLEAMGTPKGASSLVENARLLTKEQLVYALRLTGAKLRDVREKAQGTEGTQKYER